MNFGDLVSIISYTLYLRIVDYYGLYCTYVCISNPSLVSRYPSFKTCRLQ